MLPHACLSVSQTAIYLSSRKKEKPLLAAYYTGDVIDDGRDNEGPSEMELPPMDLSSRLSPDLLRMALFTSASFMSTNDIRSRMLLSLAGRRRLLSGSGNTPPPARSLPPPPSWYSQNWQSILAK